MSEILLTIDGARGEGGGQILGTSLVLSMCLGKGIELTRIRANRLNPGLQPQRVRPGDYSIETAVFSSIPLASFSTASGGAYIHCNPFAIV
ncbi:MAG: RNA 3'-terminal phosphate cyclase [Gammaproteobacteria bacterium]